LILSKKGGFLEEYPLVERVGRDVMVDCDYRDAGFLRLAPVRNFGNSW